MSTVDEIEQAIRNLGPQDLAVLREWFAAFDADLWDRQLEQDVTSRRLDRLAKEALRDPLGGHVTDHWPEQTLDQLEGVDWGEPTYPSYVVTNSHRLRKKPLQDFTPEDLRFMLGQQISLSILMPMALDVLEVDSFAAGDMYPGALLYMALRVDAQFWQEYPQMWYRLYAVTADIGGMVRTLDESLLPAAKAFRAAEPSRDNLAEPFTVDET